jgi:pimeloyl-ACP methyl ester carboxylesterase
MFESRTIGNWDGQSFSGRANRAESTPTGKPPLIVAVHGGSYSSAYFDVPGYSLLEQADGFGIPVIAIDRSSYGQSTPLAHSDSTIARNAEVLVGAVGEIWEARKDLVSGVFLVGHSIGGAIVVTMAASKPVWPLLGIAVSGVGLATAPGDDARWASLPEGLVTLPTEIKDVVMFGPEGTFEADMPAASHVANTTCPRAELIDITTTWSRVVPGVASKVAVPVHYRQAEFDRLWVVDKVQVDDFAAAFTSAPLVDSRLFLNAGHCIDFHSVAGRFHDEQLKFALRCSGKSNQA